MLAYGRRIAVLLVAAGLLAAPARAEIEKFMNPCDGKLCAFFRVSITVPDGWVEDKEATDYFKLQMLLPKGIAFDKAPAKIYAVARYNPKKLPIADFASDSINDWKSRAKNSKIVKLDDLTRGPGKTRYVRYQFDAASLKEQGYELQAITKDMDKDGNEYAVTITLSANSLAARKAAEPAFQAILAKY